MGIYLRILWVEFLKNRKDTYVASCNILYTSFQQKVLSNVPSTTFQFFKTKILLTIVLLITNNTQIYTVLHLY